MLPSDDDSSPSPITRRLHRSLNQPLRLVHHSDSHFFILGSTGNVYTLTLSTAPTCDCPDPTTPCKHILFLYTRLLSLPLDHPCLRRTTLTPSELTTLLSSPVSEESRVGERVRERFLKLYRAKQESSGRGEESSVCPGCLEEMGRRLLACGVCKNPIREECLRAWKCKCSKKCVICRRWGEVKEKYINLSEFVDEDCEHDYDCEHEDGEEDCEDDNEGEDDDEDCDNDNDYDDDEEDDGDEDAEDDNKGEDDKDDA